MGASPAPSAGTGTARAGLFLPSYFLALSFRICIFVSELRQVHMAWYVVSYDLRGETSADDYRRVHDTLRTAAAFCWPLLSFWVIETSLSPRGVIDRLLQMSAIDDNDGIVVLEITGVGDFRRLGSQAAIDWLNSRLLRR